MAITVRITETYDLKTTTGKLGVIGIHTPNGHLLNKLYPGLVKNHKFVKLKSCDVVGACASVLPADPLQVGVEAGDVAPEDMFNPILYKAMSNDSFDTLLSRLYAVSGTSYPDSVDWAVLSDQLTTDQHFEIYYSMLADSKKWRKAMPQRGFGMKGLYPICYTMVNNYGNITIPDEVQVAKNGAEFDPENYIEVDDLKGIHVSKEGFNASQTDVVVRATTFRGKPVKMPSIPLHSKPEYVGTFSGDPDIPRTWVMALLTPPARLHEFYYRMRVTWTMTFYGLISTTETGSGGVLAENGQITHASAVVYDSSKLELVNSSNMVDANGVSVNKIMES